MVRGVLAGLVLAVLGACSFQPDVTSLQYIADSAWAKACQDISELYEVDTCDYDAPAIVSESYLIQELTGVYGIFVWDEWRIYLSTEEYIVLVSGGEYSVETVLYHEMVHAILYGDKIEKERCASERAAREMTDDRYGTTGADGPWEVMYRCVAPARLL